MNNPLVSVLMTAYNREKYIAQAIESVLHSTFTDFELIIVDDCSTDNTVNIAKRYLGDPRVHIHLNPCNLGDYPNRNQAAKFATGKYLKYVDSDDLIYPHGLQIMVDSMEKFPGAGIGFAVSQYDDDRLYPILLTPETAYYRNFFIQPIFSKAPLSAVIWREAFSKAHGFSPIEGANGDFEMWLRLSANFPVVLISDGLIWWRSHNEQETEYRKASRVKDISRQYQLTISALTSIQCPLKIVDRMRIMSMVKYNHTKYILKLALSGSPQTAWAIMEQSGLTLSDIMKIFYRSKNR